MSSDLVGLEAGIATILITFTGKVKFKDSKARLFYQTVLLSAQENKWKIISDNYRYVES